MPFKAGDPRPAGSGMPKGKKTAKTVDRENAAAVAKKELGRLCKQFAGLTSDEIFEAMEYDPLVHAILLATTVENPATQQKLVDGLMKKRYPDLKSVEVTGQTSNELVIRLGSPEATSMFANSFNRPALTNETTLDADFTELEPAIVPTTGDDDHEA